MTDTSETATNENATKRVLIYRLGSLGDMVVALPVLHLVARAFPNAERRMLTNFPVDVKAAPAAAILEGSGLVHGYFRYVAGTRSVGELLALWWRLMRWRPEVLVYAGAARDLQLTERDERFFRMCGIKRLIGVPLTEDMRNNRWSKSEQAWEPEAERLARNVAELGDARLELPANWDLDLTEAEKARAVQVLAGRGGRKVIAVSVGTKRQSKDWGKENWRELLGRLARLYPEDALVLVGAAEERETSEFAAEGWRKVNPDGPVVELCGVLTPRESAAVLARARLFIGHDSGSMHLAAAMQTPCVAVFSARNKPRVWFPYGRQHRVIYHRVECWGCGLEVCVVERKRCLTSISVDEVCVEVQHALG